MSSLYHTSMSLINTTQSVKVALLSTSEVERTKQETRGRSPWDTDLPMEFPSSSSIQIKGTLPPSQDTSSERE
jgi:hypothetical protein